MSHLKIRTMIKEDLEMYKKLRLLSLKDSPDSFGSTYEREAAFPDTEWISRLDTENPSTRASPLAAEINGIAAGLAFGVCHSPEDKTAHVYQMWVAPDARGQGIGKMLLKQIVTWAKEASLKDVSLAVTTTNAAAVQLYQSMEFQPFGELEELREGSALSVQPMKLVL